MKPQLDKLSKKDIRAIVLFVLCVLIVGAGVAWLLIEFFPYLLFAIAFIPWLFAALKEGGDV